MRQESGSRVGRCSLPRFWCLPMKVVTELNSDQGRERCKYLGIWSAQGGVPGLGSLYNLAGGGTDRRTTNFICFQFSPESLSSGWHERNPLGAGFVMLAEAALARILQMATPAPSHVAVPWLWARASLFLGLPAAEGQSLSEFEGWQCRRHFSANLGEVASLGLLTGCKLRCAGSWVLFEIVRRGTEEVRCYNGPFLADGKRGPGWWCWQGLLWPQPGTCCHPPCMRHFCFWEISLLQWAV